MQRGIGDNSLHFISSISISKYDNNDSRNFAEQSQQTWDFKSPPIRNLVQIIILKECHQKEVGIETEVWNKGGIVIFDNPRGIVFSSV